ncbi:hypothetical protein AVEN_8998-1 [Araneus ventricosus]|uniref:Uncharacterized protein n=1 Tax=Araneus ventricosus TaxID=182803 RepID=A0A4Y2DPF4_ARAVE|nr:hypothetical protein AVEN_8998-1 [Araneus ventricosus]
MMAVAIGTGYRTGNPFRVGRSSFKIFTLADLAPNRNERPTVVRPRRRIIIYTLTDVKNKIKPRLPADSSYSKWLLPNITSCHSDRHQPGNLAGRILVADSQ